MESLELTLTSAEWEARERALTESTFQQYEAGEISISDASQQWAAQRSARRMVDPEYDRECLEKEAQRLEEEATQAEATIAEIQSGNFCSFVANPDAEIPGLRHYADQQRLWARQRRQQLGRDLRTIRTPRQVVRRSAPVSRSREPRPKHRSSTRRARAPSRDPDEPAPPLGRLSPLEDWRGVLAASERIHTHVLQRIAAARTA